jgi:hypothetical protein
MRPRGHGGEVADRVVRELRIEARVDDHATGREQDRVAVRRRFRGHADGDIAGARRDDLDDELLPPGLAQFLGNEATDQVAWPARCGRHDHAHRPRRISLRPSEDLRSVSRADSANVCYQPGTLIS